MEPSEYLELVTQQIRCKKARGFIAQELLAHIEEQAQSYREEGIPRDEAKKSCQGNGRPG